MVRPQLRRASTYSRLLVLGEIGGRGNLQEFLGSSALGGCARLLPLDLQLAEVVSDELVVDEPCTCWLRWAVVLGLVGRRRDRRGPRKSTAPSVLDRLHTQPRMPPGVSRWIRLASLELVRELEDGVVVEDRSHGRPRARPLGERLFQVVL